MIAGIYKTFNYSYEFLLTHPYQKQMFHKPHSVPCTLSCYFHHIAKSYVFPLSPMLPHWRSKDLAHLICCKPNTRLQQRQPAIRQLPQEEVSSSNYKFWKLLPIISVLLYK